MIHPASRGSQWWQVLVFKFPIVPAVLPFIVVVVVVHHHPVVFIATCHSIVIVINNQNLYLKNFGSKKMKEKREEKTYLWLAF
jgi:hypothetical protein